MAAVPSEWLDKRVSDLPLECFKEAGKCLSTNIGPNYEDLAARVDLWGKLSREQLRRSDNPGYLVLERYQQLPDSSVIALMHILQALDRQDVIRIINRYIHDPFTFTLMLREEHGNGVIRCFNIPTFASESVKDAIKSYPGMKDIPFDNLQYIGETRIPGKIDSPKVKTSLFKGRQVSMQTCVCKVHHPVQETDFRSRSNTTGCEGARPKHTAPLRNALSSIPENHMQYQALYRGADSEDVPDFVQPGDTFGSTLPRKKTPVRQVMPLPNTRSSRDSSVSVDSALPGSARGSRELPDDGPLYDETELGLADMSLQDNATRQHGRDSGISLGTGSSGAHTDLSLRLQTDPGASGEDVYLTTGSQDDNLYENVEPPGFHGDVRTNSQIDAVLKPYLHKDNCYITRRSSSHPEFKRSISITYRGKVWNYRILVAESELLNGQPHFSYSLFEETGPFFASMDGVFEHYRNNRIADTISDPSQDQGPYLLHPIEADTVNNNPFIH